MLRNDGARSGVPCPRGHLKAFDLDSSFVGMTKRFRFLVPRNDRKVTLKQIINFKIIPHLP